MKRELTSKIVFGLCLGLIGLSITATSFAADYHVHPILGDDNNPGTKPELAFKTLQRASKLALKPGDRLLLAAGQTFEGQLELEKITGTVDKPVVISSYVTREESRGLPAVIDAKGFAAGVLLNNCAQIELSNLRITANGGGMKSPGAAKAGMRCGVLIQADERGEYAGFTLANLTVRDVFYEEPGFTRSPEEVRTANGTQHYGWGIRFINHADDALMRDITIRNCAISNVCHTGLKFTARSNGLERVRVEDVRVFNVGGPGVQMSGVCGGRFSQLDVNRSGSTNDTRNWGRGSGLWTWGSSDIVIERSRFQNANGPGDSAGVHIDFNCRNVVVQYNLSANNAGGFCEVLGNNHNCAYRYNISVNDGHRIKGKSGAFQEGKTFWLSGYTGDKAPRSGPFNTYFYNNTIYVEEDIVAKFAVGPTARGVLIANNVFYIKGRSASVVGDQNRADSGKAAALPNVVFQNNLFLRADNWPGDSVLQDQAPLIGDPEFAQGGGLRLEDYVPRNASLVRNRGIVIPRLPQDETGLLPGLQVERDILGEQIVGMPDLGAIELPPSPAVQASR
jgi:hypothetical protein